MKNILKSILPVLLLAVLASCGKDNYDAPKSTLKGHVTYNGQALNVRGTGEAVRLQLYQDGYDKHDPINVFVGQDGAFSAKLFDGEYKMVTRDGNGPWVNKRDTVKFVLKGSATVDMEVTPFFTVSNEKLAVSGNTYTASFTINQVVSTSEIDYAIILLSKTQFADDVNNLFRKDFSDVKAGSVNLSATFDEGKAAEISNAKALFARVGVRAKGADQAIYSPVVRIR